MSSCFDLGGSNKKDDPNSPYLWWVCPCFLDGNIFILRNTDCRFLLQKLFAAGCIPCAGRENVRREDGLRKLQRLTRGEKPQCEQTSCIRGRKCRKKLQQRDFPAED
jgi:hypothetical protein